MADSKISALTDAGTLASGDFFVIERGGTSNRKKALLGYPELVYRYTVTGSDKTSIDTGVDTADAGTNDWTNGDLLEILLYARTDEAVARSLVNLTVNNDGSSIYDLVFETDVNASVSGNNTRAAAAWQFNAAGASAASGVFGTLDMRFPNFSGTVANKFGSIVSAVMDTAAASTQVIVAGLGYRSTTALTRFAVTPATGGKKLKVGSQLLIYKRIAA